MNSEGKIAPPTDLEVAKRIAVGLGYDWDKQCWLNDPSSLTEYCFIYAARCLGCFDLPYEARILELERQIEAAVRQIEQEQAIAVGLQQQLDDERQKVTFYRDREVK